MSEAKLYNARVIDTYLKLIQVKYPHINGDLLVKRVGLELYEVADQGNWFTQEQINRFYANVVRATGNENIAREAGRFAATPDALGTMRQYALALMGPGKAFDLIGKLSGNLTKSADYKTRMVGKNSVEVLVTPRPDIVEEPFQCENRIGFFEALVGVFGYKGAKVGHEQCWFEGYPACLYTISWQPSSTATIKKMRDIFAVAAATLIVAGAFVYPAITVQAVLPVSVIGFLSLNWWLETSRKQQAEITLDQLRDSSEQLTDQISLNYRNMQLTREVGEVVTSQNNIDDVIESVVKILEGTLDFDRGLVLLANTDTQRLEIRGAFGYTDEHLDLLEKTTFRLDNPESQGPFVVSYRQQKPLLVNDVSEISHQITEKSQLFIKALEIKSFLTVPILLEEQSIGILAVDNQQRKKPLVNSDVNLLMSIAPTIGTSFRNAALNEARENQFAATLKVLAHSIDARDFLTAGHSEQVAEYATGIAMELGKSHDYCQMIRVAALLHDYGKIGIPDTVLKKDGPLTDSEREEIRTHSAKSHDILVQVPFEGLNKEIPLIALHHHEKWDGTGYPEGLAGQEIPFGARIVAVADFFEAITAKRHYRDPMPDDVAIEELKKGSGSHFDPHLVHVFLRYLRRRRDQSGPGAPRKDLPQLREPRYAFQSPVEAKVAKLSLNGEVVDISKGGAFLQLDKEVAKQIEKHSKIALKIDLPNARNIPVEGEVRWVNYEDGRVSDRHPIGIGVAFTDLDQKARTLINRTVRRLIHGSGKILYPKRPAIGNNQS